MPSGLPDWARPLRRTVAQGLRRMRGQPGHTIRLNHPVTPESWDRQKGVVGWVASDQPVKSVRIRSQTLVEEPVKLVRRLDVEHHLSSSYACQIGFMGARPIQAWLGDATSCSLMIEVTLADGSTAEHPVQINSNPDQGDRYARFRPLFRCPECRGELQDLETALRCPACGIDYPVRRGVADFLTQRIVREYGVEDTDNISSWSYDPRVDAMLAAKPDGVFLDCGAGLRHRFIPQILNYEIVDYSTTDVLGVGEKLPFADASFDGVISVAVLEHVQDPFRCASELQRVLKPGGTLFAAVPFLQPQHGYPHHYYNMTKDGLRRLFGGMEVLEQVVPLTCHPIESLRWFLLCYCRGLPEKERRVFEQMTVREFMDLPPNPELARNPVPVVEALSPEARFEIASATCLLARKP